MQSPNIEAALRYVDTTDSPLTRSRSRVDADNTMALNTLDTVRQQSAVVGSEVVAFAEDVLGLFRQYLVNSTLLAQFVANKRVSDRAWALDWCDEYFNAPSSIGLPVQDRNFAIYTGQGDN